MYRTYFLLFLTIFISIDPDARSTKIVSRAENVNEYGFVWNIISSNQSYTSAIVIKLLTRAGFSVNKDFIKQIVFIFPSYSYESAVAPLSETANAFLQ